MKPPHPTDIDSVNGDRIDIDSLTNAIIDSIDFIGKITSKYISDFIQLLHKKNLKLVKKYNLSSEKLINSMLSRLSEANEAPISSHIWVA